MEVAVILQQSLVEVWRIDIYLIDQKSIEILLIDISPIGKVGLGISDKK
jgi:hypothetical protein